MKFSGAPFRAALGALVTMMTIPGKALEEPRADAATADSVARLLAEAAPDVTARLARWKPLEMLFDGRSLSLRERQLVEKLVAACRDLENLYWRQSDPAAIPVYRSLAGASTERDRAVRRLLWINGSRWDLVDENRPFLGKAPMPPGRALYPEGLTRERSRPT